LPLNPQEAAMIDFVPSMYTKTHHNIIEFWCKTNFLQKIEIDMIEISHHNNDIEYKYRNFSNPKKTYQKIFNWASQGGNFKVFINNEKKDAIKIFNNLKSNLTSTMKEYRLIDCLLYNKYSNFHHLEIKGVGISSLNIDSNSGYYIMTGWFAKMG
jgi:hypothetical protein